MVIVSLIAIVVLNALGLGLITLTNTEAAIAANHREASEVLYAAEAAAECAASEIMPAASWSDVLSGATRSAFEDGTRTPLLASGVRLDLNAMTTALQAESDADARRGANNPRWRLFLYRPLSQIARTGGASAYVVAWVADDLAETDNDPLVDGNGAVTIRAQAMGQHGTQRTIEATIAKENLGVGILSWREIR